jgi:hypothetical protein
MHICEIWGSHGGEDVSVCSWFITPCGLGRWYLPVLRQKCTQSCNPGDQYREEVHTTFGWRMSREKSIGDLAIDMKILLKRILQFYVIYVNWIHLDLDRIHQWRTLGSSALGQCFSNFYLREPFSDWGTISRKPTPFLGLLIYAYMCVCVCECVSVCVCVCDWNVLLLCTRNFTEFPLSKLNPLVLKYYLFIV